MTRSTCWPRARLAATRGEPVAPWCHRLAALPAHPAGGLLMRRVALATLQNAALPELERLLADEPWNPAAQARVGAIEPGDHTRMVAALRLAT